MQVHRARSVVEAAASDAVPFGCTGRRAWVSRTGPNASQLWFLSLAVHSVATGVVGQHAQGQADAEPEGQGAWKRRKTTAERKAEQVGHPTRAAVHEYSTRCIDSPG